MNVGQALPMIDARERVTGTRARRHMVWAKPRSSSTLLFLESSSWR